MLVLAAVLGWFPAEFSNPLNRGRDEPDDFALVELEPWLPPFGDPAPADWPMGRFPTYVVCFPGGRTAYFTAIWLDPFRVTTTPQSLRANAGEVAKRCAWCLKNFCGARGVGRRTYYVERPGPDGRVEGAYYFLMKAVVGYRAGCLMFSGKTAEEARVTPRYVEDLVESDAPPPAAGPGGGGVDPGPAYAALGAAAALCLAFWWLVVRRVRRASGRAAAARPTTRSG
jgi:hypothetical protein